uniref:Uncharacterized protein n=1 Tax=Vespula pensylvanica TaxID=30213 RepID=A0A834NYP0_VESPE|nr:hypothetical protein H0235_009537 [Vespula pensylvanica]
MNGNLNSVILAHPVEIFTSRSNRTVLSRDSEIVSTVICSTGVVDREKQIVVVDVVIVVVVVVGVVSSSDTVIINSQDNIILQIFSVHDIKPQSTIIS